MNLRMFMTLGSVFTLIYGIGYVLFPTQLLSIGGVTTDGLGTGLAQFLGAAMLGFGTVNWLARDLARRDAASVRHVLIGNLVGTGVGFIVTLLAMLSGSTGFNALGWVTVLVGLLLALGNAYFLFMPQAKPVAAARK